MSNKLSVVEQGIAIEDIDGLTAKEVIQWIGFYIRKLAEDGLKLGFLVLKAEALKCDLREVSRVCTILPLCKMFAQGLIAEAAFTRFYDREDVLECIALLPIPLQEELAERGTITICEITPDGKTTKREIELQTMTPAQRALAFHKKERRLTTDAEQAGRLNSKFIEEKRKTSRFTYDEKNGLVDCERMTPDEIRAKFKKLGI